MSIYGCGVILLFISVVIYFYFKSDPDDAIRDRFVGVNQALIKFSCFNSSRTEQKYF